MPAWPDDARLAEDVYLLCEGPIERTWDTTRIHRFTVHNRCLDVELGMRRRRQADATSAPNITRVRSRVS
jgi:hypothetical protein